MHIWHATPDQRESHMFQEEHFQNNFELLKLRTLAHVPLYEIDCGILEFDIQQKILID